LKHAHQHSPESHQVASWLSFGHHMKAKPNKSLQPTRITPLVLRFGFLFYHVTIPAWLSSGRSATFAP
jgi:hypothetical protein